MDRNIVNNFDEEISKLIELGKNKEKFEKMLNDKEELYKELEEKGIIYAFYARKNNNIFRENKLTSEESARNSKKAKEAYIAIQKAVLYNLNNPLEAKKWLDTLAPYLNNATLNLESYIHSGVPKLDISNTDDYAKVEDKINEYSKMIYTEGATKTILNILSEYGYNMVNVTPLDSNSPINDIVNDKDYNLTDEQLLHNEIWIRYLEIDRYGMLTDDLKEQLNNRELLVNKLIESNEIKDYLQKMEERTNNATFSQSELTEEDISNIIKKKSITYPAFIENVISKISPKQTENKLSDEEIKIKKQIEELTTTSIDLFAYQLRDLKDYINNPEKSLNLSDGTNIIEEITQKAEALGYMSDEIDKKIKNNKNINNFLVNYTKNQLNDLIVYGCFLTSKCNDIIEQRNLTLKDFENYQEEKTDNINNESAIEEKQLPAIRIDIEDIINKIVNSGTAQTAKEQDVIKELSEINQNSDNKVITEVENQINNLNPSKNKEIISESWNKFISQLNQPKTKLDSYNLNIILDNLVNNNKAISDKQNIEIGMRIYEIQDEKVALEEELRKIKEQNRTSTLDNGLSLIETITNSDNRDNKNYAEYYQNIILQKQLEAKELINSRNNLIKNRDSFKEDTKKNFIDNFNEHRKNRDRIRKNNPIDEKELQEEKECAKVYLELRKLIEDIEKLNVSPITKSHLGLDNNQSKTSIEKQESKIEEIRNIINKIRDNKIYSKSEIDNFNKLYELMCLEVAIAKNTTQIGEKQLELAQIQANNNSNNTKEEIINQKILKLEKEEEELSNQSIAFNPDKIKNDISSMIERFASKEEISQKLDELILPIRKNNEIEIQNLNYEIKELKTKLSKKENYIDKEKIDFDSKKLENIGKQLEIKKQELEKLREKQIDKHELEVLKNYKNILLAQQISYQEEKEILLQWNIEETESDKNTRDALIDLLRESKENLSSIQQEITNCNKEIEELEKNNEIIAENLDKDIKNTELAIEKLDKKYEKLNKALNERKSVRYIDKELELSDLEELNRKQQKLNELNLEAVKEEFLNIYDKEMQISIAGPLPLPGKLENGQEIKSDGNIIDAKEKDINNKVLELPGKLENGDELKSDWTIKNAEISKEEIESITDGKASLLEKAQNKFKKIGKNIMDWIKEHPKLAIAIGSACVVTTMAGISIIKALSGENLATIDQNNNAPLEPSTKTETEADTTINNPTDIEIAVDKSIDEIEESNKESTVSFKTTYESAIDNILENKMDVYKSADRAILNQNPVKNLHMKSFENANLNKIYKLEDGKLFKISYDEAQEIVEKGGQVSVAVENDGVGIGYITIGNEEINNLNENAKGISK